MRRVQILFWLVALTACGASSPKKDLGLEKILADFENLRSDAEVLTHAPAELQDAQTAVRELRMLRGKQSDVRAHLGYLVSRTMDIARARASERAARVELSELERDRDRILLEASLREAERARAEAERLRRENIARVEETERAQRAADVATSYSQRAEREAGLARQEAEQARRLAQAQAREADLARQEADLASATAETLRRQLENLQARETNRGLMFTLGDVLFEYGKAGLRPESLEGLDQLIDFIEQYPNKTVSIEGHTDARGSDVYNLDLSQQRANAVRQALIDRGVDQARLTAVGLGEEFPISSNETELGRQQNRRVEIVILNDA